MASDFNERHLRWLLDVQSGVIARRQLLEVGLTDNDIERMVRRRDLTVVRGGVYVDHTGPLTWSQREWVAVLALWPAALSHESAIPGVSTRRIHVAIGLHRRLQAPPGVAVHQTADLQRRVDWPAAPPRVKVDHAVIDVMSARLREDDVAGAFDLLTRACFRATTPERIERTLAQRARVPHRRLVADLLADRRTGACSVLERGYLHRVERAHGLPAGRRQRHSTATGGRTDQDVRYEEYGVVVELDGRVVHDHPGAWDADARRDLAELAVADAVTARVTYGLVFREQCATAGWIGQILRRNGWRGTLLRCPRCPVR